MFLEAAELEYLAGKIKISADYNLLDNKINLLAKAENIALQELPNAKGLEGRVNLDIVAAGLLSLEKIDLTGNLKLGAFKYQGLSITEASLDFLKNNKVILHIHEGPVLIENLNVERLLCEYIHNFSSIIFVSDFVKKTIVSKYDIDFRNIIFFFKVIIYTWFKNISVYWIFD